VSACRSCGAPVIWVKTMKGGQSKSMPINAAEELPSMM